MRSPVLTEEETAAQLKISVECFRTRGRVFTLPGCYEEDGKEIKSCLECRHRNQK